jgi:hypothetical protein
LQENMAATYKLAATFEKEQDLFTAKIVAQ